MIKDYLITLAIYIGLIMLLAVPVFVGSILLTAFGKHLLGVS